MTTPSLTQFQDDFVHAIYDRHMPPARLAAVASQPGFSIDRNSVIKGCIDALQANFPSVERLVGNAWFRAAAADYVRQAPPADVRLMHYGGTFPEFIERYAPAHELPYLADVARLDHLWMDVHTAADAPPFEPAMFGQLEPAALGNTVLRPHPATRWTWFARQPVFSIWRVSRERVEWPGDVEWSGEGALLTRIDGAVRWQAIGMGGCAFLDACAAGATLEQSANAALASAPTPEVGPLLAELVAAGAFAALPPAQSR